MRAIDPDIFHSIALDVPVDAAQIQELTPEVEEIDLEGAQVKHGVLEGIHKQFPALGRLKVSEYTINGFAQRGEQSQLKEVFDLYKLMPHELKLSKDLAFVIHRIRAGFIRLW